MSGTRTKLIIAVFGGTDPDAINKARALGAIIAQRSHILLTGGTRPSTARVSESAIDGVRSSAWVGVARSNKIVTEPWNSGLVIYTDLGHKRNYLEAHLCDAAIGLSGGDGTVSEVTFSLALQRPVVLVGDDWKKSGCLDDASRPAVLMSMVNRAFNRVGRESSGRPDLDALLNESAISAALAHLPPYMYLASSEPVEDAVDWIENVFKTRAKSGHFPTLKGYESLAAEYEEWLSKRGV
jgi:uncharacterized protein (TIGR00725 family)